MRKVALTMIRPDMYLAKPVYYYDQLLIRSGTKDITKYIPNLQRLGISYVYVEDKASEGIEIPDAISDETRQKCKVVLQDTIKRFTVGGAINLDETFDIIEHVLEEVITRPNIMVSLNDISTKDDNTLTHSVNTTVYALMIAKNINYSREQLKELAQGTLLHDIGKTVLDQTILFKKGRLTEQEYRHIKMHTILGYNVLKRTQDLPEISRIIALSHHERLDGSGYPEGLMGEQIHDYVRIVSIADVYDALTAERCYRGKWSSSQAVDHLMKGAIQELDASKIAIFLQQIAIYPNGSLVRLSNQCIGIVKDQNKNVPLRPIIRVITDAKGKLIPFYEIDLLKELSITIIESEIEIDSNKNCEYYIVKKNG